VGRSGEGIANGSEEVGRRNPVMKHELMVKSKSMTKPKSRTLKCPVFLSSVECKYLAILKRK
jgi:hypothetical protein